MKEKYYLDTKSIKKLTKDLIEEGKSYEDVIIGMTLFYGIGHISKRSLQEALKEMGWRIKGKVGKRRDDGGFEINFKPNKEVRERLGVTKDQYLAYDVPAEELANAKESFGKNR